MPASSAGPGLHHAMQGAGFDLFLEFDAFQAWVAAGEPVAEAHAGEVLVGEQDRDPPLGPVPVMMTSAPVTLSM